MEIIFNLVDRFMGILQINLIMHMVTFVILVTEK